MSPSQFTALRNCMLKAVFKSNKIPSLLPQSPSSTIGSVVHQIFELSHGKPMDNEFFQNLWDRCVSQQEEKMLNCWFERHFVPLRLTARNFHLKKSQCFLLLDSRESYITTENSTASNSLQEEWLRSRDGLVVGRADEIRFGRGCATIIDFKTGHVTDESNEVLAYYQEQLKLYAALFHEQYGNWPKDLIIKSLDGEIYHIDFEEGECQILLEESKAMLRQVNNILEHYQTLSEKAQMKLAAPEPKKCRYCRLRPICEPYFQARQKTPDEDWPNDVWGTVEKVKELRNGLVKIVLTPLSGASSISIRCLRPERHPALKSCKKIGVFSVRSDKLENHYKEGQYTTIYGID
jgi:RecB family exonuclease